MQFNKVSGPGNDVSFNSGVNWATWADPEDLLSAFSSNGTAASPLRFSNNCFQGGGSSTSGGGLVREREKERERERENMCTSMRKCNRFHFPR